VEVVATYKNQTSKQGAAIAGRIFVGWKVVRRVSDVRLVDNNGLEERKSKNEDQAVRKT
jgi:hypothetical protein